MWQGLKLGHFYIDHIGPKITSLQPICQNLKFWFSKNLWVFSVAIDAMSYIMWKKEHLGPAEGFLGEEWAYLWIFNFLANRSDEILQTLFPKCYFFMFLCIMLGQNSYLVPFYEYSYQRKGQNGQNNAFFGVDVYHFQKGAVWKSAHGPTLNRERFTPKLHFLRRPFGVAEQSYLP